MPVETQGKVVRALVEQTFLRVGGSKRVRVDVRIVSSTSRDLEALIAQGRFREDLFHRLSVVPVRVPSLSERREDIVDLVEHFVKQYSVVSGQPRRIIAQDALAILQMHEWPGNVRQLRNNVERLLILVGGDPGTEITAAMMPADRHTGQRGQCGASDGDAAQGCAGGLRARLSGGAARPVRQQHLEDGRFRRHGALGAPPQAQASRHRRERQGRGWGGDVIPQDAMAAAAGAIDTGRQKSEM
jgi:DNA-binding NtrC family response regulator